MPKSYENCNSSIKQKMGSEPETTAQQSATNKVGEASRTRNCLYKALAWVSQNPTNITLLFLETGGGTVAISKGEWFWFLMILLVNLVHLRHIKVKDVDLPELIRALYPWKAGKEAKLNDKISDRAKSST